jgi:hypothetical protein
MKVIYTVFSGIVNGRMPAVSSPRNGLTGLQADPNCLLNKVFVDFRFLISYLYRFNQNLNLES